jgi:hypothetical protein
MLNPRRVSTASSAAAAEYAEYLKRFGGYSPGAANSLDRGFYYRLAGFA